MAASPDRVCWDSCAWIALINEEKKLVEDGIDRYTRCRSVIERASEGKMEIICSALCLAEVCKNRNVSDTSPDKIAAFFEHDYLLTVALGREIAEKARELMLSKLDGLKPPDACHLATAVMTPQVKTLHTFDKTLRNLSEKIEKSDGTPIQICLPDVVGPTPPLLTGSGSE